jgi:preprotein translocase subunit SecG
MSVLLMILLIFSAIFLIILILIQRGKGGGLAGAFGGLGGQSAFGAKAGDLFTKITIGAAAVWIVLCIISVRLLGTQKEVLNPNLGGGNAPAQQAPGPATPEKQPVAPEKQPANGGGQPSSNVPSTPPK